MYHSDDVGLQDQQNVNNKSDETLVFICNVLPEERSFQVNWSKTEKIVKPRKNIQANIKQIIFKQVIQTNAYKI